MSRSILFGQVALDLGYLTREELDEALRAQAQLKRRVSSAPALGAILVRRGVLTPQQVSRVLEASTESVPPGAFLG